MSPFIENLVQRRNEEHLHCEEMAESVFYSDINKHKGRLGQLEYFKTSFT